jgi:hypothetical protein
MLCVTIIKLVGAMAKCVTIPSQPANPRFKGSYPGSHHQQLIAPTRKSTQPVMFLGQTPRCRS